MAEKDVKKNIVSVPALDMPKITGMGTAFFDAMLKYKDEIAQIDAKSGEEETYNYLLQKSIRTAIAMRSKGLTSGDIISICSFNHLNSCVPFLAGLFLDVTTASLDPTIPLSDIIHLLKQVGSKMIFVEPGAVELIENALEETQIDAKIVVFGETTKHLQFSEFLEPSPEEENFGPVDIKDVKSTAVILFSSGTTGLPKGICLNHYGLLASFYQNDVYICRGETGLTFSPMYWISSITAILHCIMNGATRLIYPKFNSEEIWYFIEKYKVNALSLAVPQLISMCKNGKPEGADISSLRYVRIGGAPLSGEQMLKIRKCLEGVIVAITYGQTELSGGGITFRFASDPEHLKFQLEKPESCGKVMPGYSYKIVDPDTEEILGPYQKGELRAKSEIQMNGYYNIDSSDCWDSDGFLKTGDIAYYDDDLCFYIVDRIREMLKFQTFQVQPAKIESILLNHPAIENAVVIGLPHPEDVDHPMGIVILKQSAVGSVTAEEIEKYVEARVDDRQKLRGGVKIVKSFPTTPSGKVKRNYLKTMVLQGETW